MADKTGVAWTDATWNPIVGCDVVSPGCTNCYAMAMAARIERMAAGSGRSTHYAGLTQASKAGPVWTGAVRTAPDSILTKPLTWRQPRRIFVNSMGDLFHEAVPDEALDRVFAVMALAPQHTFQVLTKRPERMRNYVTRAVGQIADRIMAFRGGEFCRRCGLGPNGYGPLPHLDAGKRWWPLANVWLGVTAEDQTRANERIPILLDTPAAVRFVSVEPMLGPVDLQRIAMPEIQYETGIHYQDVLRGGSWSSKPFFRPSQPAEPQIYFTNHHDTNRLDWVICGGESGRGARPMHPDWARSLRDQCGMAGVPFFFKQWGEWAPLQKPDGGWWPTNVESHMRLSPDGRSDDNGWPMQRVGTARAGRLIDGVEHNAFPEG